MIQSTQSIQHFDGNVNHPENQNAMVKNPEWSSWNSQHKKEFASQEELHKANPFPKRLPYRELATKSPYIVHPEYTKYNEHILGNWDCEKSYQENIVNACKNHRFSDGKTFEEKISEYNIGKKPSRQKTLEAELTKQTVKKSKLTGKPILTQLCYREQSGIIQIGSLDNYADNFADEKYLLDKNQSRDKRFCDLDRFDIAKVLKETFFRMLKLNPEICITDAWLHLDEASPHIHFTYVILREIEPIKNKNPLGIDPSPHNLYMSYLDRGNLPPLDTDTQKEIEHFPQYKIDSVLAKKSYCDTWRNITKEVMRENGIEPIDTFEDRKHSKNIMLSEYKSISSQVNQLREKLDKRERYLDLINEVKQMALEETNKQIEIKEANLNNQEILLKKEKEQMKNSYATSIISINNHQRTIEKENEKKYADLESLEKDLVQREKDLVQREKDIVQREKILLQREEVNKKDSEQLDKEVSEWVADNKNYFVKYQIQPLFKAIKQWFEKIDTLVKKDSLVHNFLKNTIEPALRKRWELTIDLTKTGQDLNHQLQREKDIDHQLDFRS